MLIPASLYGQYKTCVAAARRAVARVAKGASLREAFEDHGWADPAQQPGLLVLHGPSPLIGGEAHYHMYLPLAAIDRALSKVDAVFEQAVFEQCLSVPWGLLSLSAVTNSIWTFPEHRQMPFLRALLPYWDAFTAQGDRYTAGSRTGADFWTHAITVKGVMLRRGIPREALAQCPSASHLADLVSTLHTG